MQLSSPKQLHTIERPREKLLSKGVAALTDLELLQVVIGSGVKGANVAYLASQVQDLLKSSATLHVSDLTSIKGLQTAKAAAIMAGVELGRRLSDQSEHVVSSPEDIVPLASEICFKKQEHLLTFTLDGAGHVISKRLVTIGTLTNTLVHPREVFADAVSDRAAAIILVHNHPSGDPQPSNEDKQVTKLLAQAGELLGINVQDHIIVAGHKWSSLRQAGLL